MLENQGIQVYFKPLPAIKQRCFPKKQNQLQTTNTVYKINCKQCSASYIGQSSQPLFKRLRQHKDAVSQHDLNNGIAVHHIHEGHHPDLDNPIILATESHYRTRLAIETAYIAKQGSAVTNLHQGAYARVTNLIPGCNKGTTPLPTSTTS
jgi:hypothetical protein